MRFLLEQSNVKLSDINEELSSEQLKEIKDYFGTTYYKNAFYLLTDGSYLNDILDNKMLEHKEISRIYNGDLIDFMNEGHIRLIPSAPGINLVKEPTTEQWFELSNYISYYLDKNKIFI